MKITFNLYSEKVFLSQNVLSKEDFAEFRQIAESLKQTVKIVEVNS
jgi:hypothetical protein